MVTFFKFYPYSISTEFLSLIYIHFFVTSIKPSDCIRINSLDKDGLATPIPENPDESALKIRRYLEEEFGKDLAVIVTDTQGRAFRIGAIGTAIGCSGINPLWVRIGEKDLYGRELETTEIATADELASAASLIMGQADEGLPVVLIRGFCSFDALRNVDANMDSIIMPKEFDVFRK